VPSAEGEAKRVGQLGKLQKAEAERQVDARSHDQDEQRRPPQKAVGAVNQFADEFQAKTSFIVGMDG